MSADALLEALRSAAQKGDLQATLFLPVFADWLSGGRLGKMLSLH